MSYRQWYAQLDVYDTIRRYLALLDRWKGAAPTRDRLFISDFYLANPSLLHLTHMTADVRRAFNSLKVAKPDQTFLKYPSPPILYGKMGGIQSQALHNLTGKGLLRLELVDKDQYSLSETGNALANDMEGRLVLPTEEGVLHFLTTEFASIGQGKGGLRAVTGLRRLGT
ncbi:ABC-three component system middle component 5 [Bradyrhizobium sp. RT5a]|uniref:ABC-three component system middle component 5 n=1 Tax=Bradyrhizobium sp. RT5a TaxID=3156380 RepID=UPI003399F073